MLILVDNLFTFSTHGMGDFQYPVIKLLWVAFGF